MPRRPLLITAVVALLCLACGGLLYAQMEGGERGILPLDSSGTLEIDGIHVDVGAKDAQTARLAGWRIAQREGFKMLWAKSHGVPVSKAPNLSDSTLDGIVSSIIVNHEQIGPNRYIADLGVLFDRAKAGELLGVGGVSEHSQPMLLMPVMVTAGTATSVELRNAWQRAWAQFHTSQSPIDYVRVSGLGVDPLLINAAQTTRPGRGWWRNILDIYGASDVLVAEVLVHRSYPGGPAKARFIARHGPDGEIIGGFDLTAPNSAGLAGMMDEGVRRMDQLFIAAYESGHLSRDSSLNLPPPPPPPPEEVQQVQQAPTQIQVGIVAPNAITYNSAIAHLRAVPGIDGVQQVNIALGGTSFVFVTYRGNIGSLRSILVSRGWGVDIAGGQLRMYVPKPTAAPAPQTPPASNTTGNAVENHAAANPGGVQASAGAGAQ